MSTITRPMLLDNTGQIIAERLGEIRNCLFEGAHGTIYGFHIDSSESDPEDAVTYLKDAAGMTPAYMDFTNNKFVWGSWKDAFFIPRPCMLKYDGTVDYYLMENDYTKKADGTASDVGSSAYGGNAMMEWGRDGKKIWYKIVPDAGDPTSASVYIADYQADEDFAAWSFINSQGQYVDHFYTPIYNGAIIDSKLRSLSGIAGSNICKTQNATTERTAARANNSSLAIWDTEVFCDNILIELLLVLMSKSLDSQTAFGKGLTDSGNETVNNGFTTGVHNDKGLFYGTNSGAAATYTNAVKVFGMENFWGFQWRRFGGLVNVKGTEKYKLTRSTLDGSTVSDYVISTTDTDYNGYLVGAALPAASGTYITAMTYSKYAYTPTAASGNNSAQYYCDGLWTNNGQVDYAYRGGASAYGALCGGFCLLLNDAAGIAYWAIGASPSCKPLS